MGTDYHKRAGGSNGWRENPTLTQNRLEEKLSEDRDDSHRPSIRPVQVVESVGEAVVVERSRLRPSVLQFPAGLVPDPAGSLELGVELATINRPGIFRQPPTSLPDFVVGGVQDEGIISGRPRPF